MSQQNSQNNEIDHDSPTETLIASFHRAKSLIPAGQELITIPPEMRVSDALKLMQKSRFSQLPVVAGKAVLNEAGNQTLRAHINEHNLSTLQELYLYILDKIEALAHA